MRVRGPGLPGWVAAVVTALAGVAPAPPVGAVAPVSPTWPAGPSHAALHEGRTPTPYLAHPRRQEALDEIARVVASAWARGDAGALAARMTEEGVVVHLEGQSHPALPVRQARAALERFLAARGTGGVEMGRVEALGGEPPRGWAEFRWLPRTPGDAAPHSVFVGFRSEEGRWRIAEIRVLE